MGANAFYAPVTPGVISSSLTEVNEVSVAPDDDAHFVVVRCWLCIQSLVARVGFGRDSCEIMRYVVE